jgi:hypothetical protein
MDYKKYSLENLENWLHDALSAGEASPQEIYDTIKNVVEEQHIYYKIGASKTNELLSLLNGNSVGHIGVYDDYLTTKSKMKCDRNDPSPECKSSWINFWEDDVIKEDKVVKWQLPVEVDDAAGDADPIYYVNFPDDLLEAANLKEGDLIEWVDNGNGSYTLRKTNAV